MDDHPALPSSRRVLLQDLSAAALAQRGAAQDVGRPGSDGGDVRNTMLKLRKLLAVRGG